MKGITRIVSGAGAAVAVAALLAACGSPAGTANGPEADIAFAQLMIPHHEQAIDMADQALQQATSPAVLALATQIKAAQDPEIAQMRGWLAAWDAPEQMDGADGMDHGDMDMGGMSAEGMMSEADMDSLTAASGPAFDRLWLQLMVAHHEGAIQMAEQVQVDSTDKDVTALAAAIIAGQTDEIARMRALLAE